MYIPRVEDIWSVQCGQVFQDASLDSRSELNVFGEAESGINCACRLSRIQRIGLEGETMPSQSLLLLPCGPHLFLALDIGELLYLAGRISPNAQPYDASPSAILTEFASFFGVLAFSPYPFLF